MEFKKTCGGKKDWGHGGFPKQLCNLVIELFSNEGDIILDCFMGMGQLGLSSIELKRDFIGIEKDLEIYKTASNIILSNP